MKRTSTTPIVVMAGALGALLVSGCNTGGDGGGTPASYGPSETYTTTMVVSGDFSLPPSQGRGYDLAGATTIVPLQSSFAGDLSAEVAWTPATEHLSIGFYPDGCTSHQLGAGACQALAQGEPGKGKGSVSLRSASSGKYVLAIQNLGGEPTSGTYRVTVEH